VATGSFGHPSDEPTLLFALEPQPEPLAPESPHPLDAGVFWLLRNDGVPLALDVAGGFEPTLVMKSPQALDELVRSELKEIEFAPEDTPEDCPRPRPP
jgi:hypothetical protein